MKTTLVCNTCRKEFETPATLCERYGTEKPIAYKKLPVCPHCRSDDYEEKKKPLTKAELREYIALSKELGRLEDKLILYKTDNDPRYDRLYELVHNHQLRCLAKMIKLQSFIYSIDDSLLRQIFELRYIEGCTWIQVSNQLGWRYSEDCLRIKHDRYLKSLT